MVRETATTGSQQGEGKIISTENRIQGKARWTETDDIGLNCNEMK